MLLKGEKVKVLKSRIYFGLKMGLLETLGHLKNPCFPLLGTVHSTLQGLPIQQSCPCQIGMYI